jgi:UDP-glucose 4-epimerase
MVTGGMGYIGSHTVVELLENNFRVLIVDNLSNSRAEVLDRIEEITGKAPFFEKIDLCDAASLRKCCAGHGSIDAIIHFAAFKAVGESVLKPLDYYENNLGSLINLLRVMGEFDINNIVFSSSCTVYGQPEVLPVTEDTPVKKATSPYGNTKQISEEMISDYIAVEPKKKAISLRYFNPVGAHPSGLIGEYPIGAPLNLVPVVTQTLIGKRKEMLVFGDDYDTPDGTGIRDYIYVVDLARAHVKALRRLMEGDTKERLEVFNLGTGKGLSVLDIIHTFEKLTNRKVNYKIHPRRPGDISEIYADVSRANRIMDWKAETPLEEILLSAWKWEQNIADFKNTQ